MFQSFLSDDGKLDASTTTAHSEHFVSLLKNQKLLIPYLSTICESTDGCAEQYICASEVLLMSLMSQCYSVITDQDINAPGHVKEVVDGLKDVYKRYMYQFMSTVRLPGSNIFDSHMQIHTVSQNNDGSLAKEFQQHLTKEHRQNGVIDQGK